MELSEILSSSGVQDTFIDILTEQGWNTELFGALASNADDLENSLKDVLGDKFVMLVPLQVAALRLGWSKCAHAVPPPPSVSPQASSSGVPQSVASELWVESMPPKLTASVVSQMKQKFKTNYPSEILGLDNTPSLRLLSMISHQKVKQDLKWIPWRFRLSAHKADEVTAARASKVPKIEGLQLNQLLDDPPSVEVSNGTLGLHALRNMFECWAYAMALNELAHLASLKEYFLRFMGFMTTRYESDSGHPGSPIS